MTPYARLLLVHIACVVVAAALAIGFNVALWSYSPEDEVWITLENSLRPFALFVFGCSSLIVVLGIAFEPLTLRVLRKLRHEQRAFKRTL